ncbi:MAG: glycosyltransferase family 2 protein, partial [Chromatiales bacterium]|nr:glycosyltransferase family 2 protein [Chromatiales bacterium]
MSATLKHAVTHLLAESGSALTEKINAIWRDEDLDQEQRCNKTIAIIEQQFANQQYSDTLISLYQALYREKEQLNNTTADRHKFIVVIPVADRPKHLKSCLESLLQLCNAYGYGSEQDGQYRKIAVLIADDSKASSSREKNRQIAQYYQQQGIESIYFGQREQQSLVAELTAKSESDLSAILGDIETPDFFHKGASIMRNITYLKLHQLYQNSTEKLLFYFIDSDQEFRVNLATPQGDEHHYLINYFYHLDQIFSHSDAQILTGKVVGDPPVSPAVMAGRLLQDLIAFFQRLNTMKAEQPCQFHGRQQTTTDGAAYHDMADLFGFSTTPTAFEYQCLATGHHNHLACLNRFTERLNHFFDGEHPTRSSSYQSQPLDVSITPARTVYTGNYIFRPEMLHYFIPFAPLKLRMAGPVLGRLIKAEIGDRFISANLPMLHRRTVEEIGQSEFRAGVDHSDQLTDIGDELERQFYGDVMLFSVTALTEQG